MTSFNYSQASSSKYATRRMYTDCPIRMMRLRFGEGIRARVIFRFLASDYAILLSLLLVLFALIRQNRSWVRWIWNDPVRWARLASRATYAALVAFLLWVTVLDNWRQLLGFLVEERERWRSDPYLNDPPADAVRVVTFVLLGLAVLGSAYLYARYARGYLIPILAGPLGFVLFFILNSLRMRFELVGPLNERSVDFTDPGEALAAVIWFMMFYTVMVILIAAAYAVLWGPAALIISLLYRNTIGRERYEETGIYRTLSERAAARDRGGREPT